MRGSIRRDCDAVSPVIATVLLLAITVMLSSMVFVLMQGALTAVEKSPPQATVSVRALDNGFHVVRITSLDQSIDPARLQYDLLPTNLSQALPMRGQVSDADVTVSSVRIFHSMTGMPDTPLRRAIISSLIPKPSELTTEPGDSVWWKKVQAFC